MTVMQNDISITRGRIKLFVDRNEFQWVVMDAEGRFWSIPSGDNPWENRTIYQPSPTTQLEPVPGHYKTMLGLPG